MREWEADLAFRHAPVVLQKAHSKYARADFITRVNFAHDWNSIHKNWRAVWEKKPSGKYRYALKAHGYYSLVESHTHYFIVYAFYHPQDRDSFHGHPRDSDPNKLGQHLHDMEGCLAVVPKRPKPEEERCEALLTISHHHFYSFAGWEDGNGNAIPGSFRVLGYEEDIDGPIQVTDRFAAGDKEPPYRFKLYVDSGGHAIRGGRKDWSGGDHVVRYRPSLTKAVEPKEDGFVKGAGDDAHFQTVWYRLVDIFGEDEPWDHHENPRVMLTNKKGQECFVKPKDDDDDHEELQLEPGSAKPPWGWDDADDRHKSGEFAWDPAHLVADYFGGAPGVQPGIPAQQVHRSGERELTAAPHHEDDGARM